MAPSIGALGVAGIAREVTAGTYVAPEKFFPLESESLKYVQDNIKRRPIRNNAGLIGVVAGNVHVEGDISLEVLDDVLPYFLMSSRCTFAKTGTGPFVYTFTPSSVAVPATTCSLSIKRNGEVFGYTGCTVGGYTLTIGTDGIMKMTAKIVGRDEATQSALTPTWPTTVPFGPGQYDLEIPTSTDALDADTFEFSVEDNAEAQFRLKATGRGASFVKFGEHQTTAKVARDFQDRTDYDTFKAITSQAIKMLASQGTDNKVQINLMGAIKDSYDMGLSGQGDLIRADITYEGVIDSAGKDFTIAVTSAADIT